MIKKAIAKIKKLETKIAGTIYDSKYHQKYEEFTGITREQASEYIKGSENQMIRLIMKTIVEEGFVLDVGCGRGIDAKLYDPRKYFGIDVSQALIDEARKNNPNYKTHFWRGEFTQMFKDYYGEPIFDYCICKAVLEHVPTENDAIDIFETMMRISDKVLIGWHLSPTGSSTQINRIKGHFGKWIFQNQYREDIFDRPYINIDKNDYENYELWIVSKK